MKMYKWKLKDVIMVGIMSVIFGVVYLGIVYFASFLTTALTPFGLAPLGNEIVYGIWFMGASIATYIMRKPGVAIVTEMLAALLEVLMGNFYGPLVFVSGFIQGLGVELGFWAFKYKRYDMVSMSLAALGCTVFSFIWGFFRSGFFELSVSLLIVMFAIRLVSSLIFTAFISKLLADKLAQAGVLKSYPIGEKLEVDLSE